MKQKRIMLFAATTLAGVSLVSCTANDSSALISSTSAADQISGVTLALGATTLSLGQSAASAGYTVTVHHTVKGDVKITSSNTNVVFTVTGPDSKTYNIGDPLLTAGTYTVSATYTKTVISNEVSISVTSATLDTTDHFVKTVTNFDNKDQYTLNNYGGDHVLKSVGDQKILVVPVDFTDKLYSDAQTEKIQKAFFGAAADTSWQSLSSFYSTSSRGKLSLTGTVTPVYHAKMTSAQAASLTIADSTTDATLTAEYSEYWNMGWYFADKVTTWYKAQINSDLTDYDKDGDGYIDAIWMVYSPDYSTGKSNGGWWAYTHRDYLNKDKGSLTAPVPYNFSWASYKFIEDSDNNGRAFYDDGKNIDAHTLVHETGHLMGLNDYYDTDGNTSPAAGMAMMDLNVGDHDPYSKMALNWITPRVIDYSSSYFQATLKPFESTGDVLLIHTNSTAKTPTANNADCNQPNMTEAWNGMPFDEYLLMIYYTPTGLNEADSKGYPEWSSSPTTYGHGGVFDKPGILVWHVDSRLIMTTADHANLPAGQVWMEWTDQLFKSTASYKTNKSGQEELSSGSFVNTSLTNTKSSCYWMTPDSNDGGEGGKMRQITLLSSDANNYNLTYAYGKRTGVSESNLFLPGSNFGFSKEKFSSFFPGDGTKTSKAPVFDDGTSLDYNFAVTSVDDPSTNSDPSAKVVFIKNS